jgi:hypothetical protein
MASSSRRLLSFVVCLSFILSVVPATPLTVSASDGAAALPVEVAETPTSNPNAVMPEAPFNPLPTAVTIARFEAETDFAWVVGRSDSVQHYANWRDNDAGYLLSGITLDGARGIALPEGTYRWQFRLMMGSDPPHLPGSPVFRLEIWDLTTGELITRRSLHASDFADENVYYSRMLVHSTAGRAGHRFEPRVFWEGFVDGFVDRVTLEQFVETPQVDLEAKAFQLDDILQADFLDPIPFAGDTLGLLVGRKPDSAGNPGAVDRGDAATWTAYYTAAEALRLTARPDDAVALERMERGFAALHALFAVTGEPGVLARYATPNGEWHYRDMCDGKWKAGRLIRSDADGTLICTESEATCQPEGERLRARCPDGRRLYEEWSKEIISEDGITAFTFAVGIGYPLIADPTLKASIAEDMRGVARNFLDHDFRIVKSGDDRTAAKRINFNPYYPSDDLEDIVAGFLDDGKLDEYPKYYSKYKHLRNYWNKLGTVADILNIISLGCVGRFPDMSDDLLPPRSDEIAVAIQQRDEAKLVQLLPSFLTSTRNSLVSLRGFLGSSVDWFQRAADCIGRLPNSSGEEYNDLIRYLREMLAEVDRLIARIPPSVQNLEDFKYDSSNAIAAAQILAVAKTVAPDEFGAAYSQYLLGGGKDLLTTMETWNGVGEEASAVFVGDEAADEQRGDTHHRSFAALSTLVRLESDPGLRQRFRALLDQSWRATSDEGNAFYEVVRAATQSRQPGALPSDLGISGWNLSRMPVLRSGYTNDVLAGLVPDVGFESSGWVDSNVFARDPLPVTVRAMSQMFLWQRNPRKLESNNSKAQEYYPSLDYLLPYWMARAAGVTLAQPTGSLAPQVYPAQALLTSNHVGITIGRGTSVNRECKGKCGFVHAPSELGTLPGPYGEVQVGRNGLDVGVVKVKMLEGINDWKLKIDPQPEGVRYSAEVCRAGGIEKEGSEVKFYIEMATPATTGPNIITPHALSHVVASSGEQGRTIGRCDGCCLHSKDEELRFTVAMPPEYGPVNGPYGTFHVGGCSYDDGQVRVHVLEYRGNVNALEITKSAEGVSFYGKVHRPGGCQKTGGEFKVVVELLGRGSASFAVSSPPALNFTADEGREAPAQVVTLGLANASWPLSPVSLSVRPSTAEGLPWLYAAPTGGTLPQELRVRASAMNLRARPEPYSGSLEVEVPGATNNPVIIPVSLTVTGQLPASRVVGHVFLDTNADGWRQSTETVGVVPVEVILTRDGVQVATTRSLPSAGWYAFSYLEPGNYCAEAVVPPAHLSTSPTKACFAFGMLDRYVDFGLEKADAAIGNFVWLDRNADGQQDPDEFGIPDVTLDLRTDSNGVPGNIVASTTTDINGAYLFTELMPGSYFVQVTDTQNVLSGLTLKTGAQSMSNPAGPIVVAQHQNYGDADFGYALVPGPDQAGIASLVWRDLDGNGLFSVGETALQGVEICASPMGHTETTCAVSDAHGIYLLLVRPGTYLVAPVSLPPGMNVTAYPRFYLPFAMRKGLVYTNANFGYR